jgi:hypothetical protein
MLTRAGNSVPILVLNAASVVNHQRLNLWQRRQVLLRHDTRLPHQLRAFFTIACRPGSDGTPQIRPVVPPHTLPRVLRFELLPAESAGYDLLLRTVKLSVSPVDP